jgi:hypothetical protein
MLMCCVVSSPLQRLREQLEEAWEEDVEGVFDVKAVRAALEARLRSVEAEKQQVRRQAGAVGWQPMNVH